LLKWWLKRHPQLPRLPTRLAHNEPEKLALFSPSLFYELIGSFAREGQQIDRCLSRWQRPLAFAHLCADALLICLDFSGLPIVSTAVDSSVETVVVKSIESPLKLVTGGLPLMSCVPNRSLRARAGQIPGECRSSLENVRLRGSSDTIQHQNWNRASN
jgi:hypothetical protein